MFTLILFLSSILTTTAAPYNSTDYLLVNCGSDSTTTFNGRSWIGDAQFSPVNSDSISNISIPSTQNSSIPQIPFMTARIFQISPFTYTFNLSAGSKFLRLHFYPATYSGLQKFDSFFSVTAGEFTLLRNFSAYLTATDEKEDVVVKEYVIRVTENQPPLKITFTPALNFYAFINGIEIVPIPDDYYIRGENNPITYVGYPNSPIRIETDTALETLYRFNVGGNEVNPTNDSGMFRKWDSDEKYVYGSLGLTPSQIDYIPIKYTPETPNYSAPEVIYTSARTMNNDSLKYNMTWIFPVDSGFVYMLRLYFCEFMIGAYSNRNQRVFTIYINNQTAEQEADVLYWTKENDIPIFKDYYLLVNNELNDHPAKQNLWLAMQPNMQNRPVHADAILNGLEIFKLSGSNQSLAGLNPELLTVSPSTPASVDKRNSKDSSVFRVIVGSFTGGIIMVVSILGFLILHQWQRSEQDYDSVTMSSYSPVTNRLRLTKRNNSTLPTSLCQRFSLAEIKSATNDFDDDFVIGKGGFGKVYKGNVNNGAILVAIKRFKETSTQGAGEFETEIRLLSKLRHRHLVSLIGYCEEYGEMILVYDYMSNGTLRDHLYETKNTPLTWKQRLQICIGSAQGLHYLHTGSKHKIIHRDVKSSNILLDEKFVAKVSDFGLSKMGPSIDMSQTHVTTAVKGSPGYLDPEYYKFQHLTEKSDVYSFGVVLFEVLCGRPAIILGLPKEQVSLANWAQQSYREGNIGNIVDPQLKAEIAPECLKKFVEVAYNCLNDRGADRPSMNDIVWNLEFALQLQESADKRGEDDKHEIIIGSYESISLNEDANTTENNDNLFFGSIDQVSKSESSSSGVTSNGSSKFKSESVFSEMMNPTAR